MSTRLQTVTFLVDNYDSAIAFFTGPLGFRLVADTPLEGGKRWVLVEAPRGGSRLLLAEAATEEQRAAIGHQAGGRVAFFLETDNFAETHARFLEAGIVFDEAPRYEAYGTVAVFRDLCGNPWDLIQMRA